jgi:hypothetical protein
LPAFGSPVRLALVVAVETPAKRSDSWRPERDVEDIRHLRVQLAGRQRARRPLEHARLIARATPAEVSVVGAAD